MRNSSNDTQEDKLKSAYQDAKKARKKAKASYKSKLKELKAKLKPFKQAIRAAEKAEKQAKSALKALEEKQADAIATTVAKPLAVADTAAPKKRGRQPGYSPKAAKAAAAVEAPVKVKGKPGRKPAEKPAVATGGGDDLTLVKGVGENIAVMLRANGVKSFADMAATSFDRYKELLKANGMSKFRDPSEWAARAAALANLPAPAPTVKAEPAPKVKGKPGRKPGFSPKAAKGVVNHEEGYKKPKTAAASASGGDDLTQVKGVGENIAVMLRANGVKSFADMAATSFDRYKELLKANGMSKFRDPSEWAARAAALANLPAPAPVVKTVAEPVEKKKRGRQPGYSPKAAKAAAAGMPVAAAPVEKKKRGRQPGYSPKAAKAAAAVEAPVQVKGKPTVAAPAEKRKRGRQPGYSPKAAKAAAAGISTTAAAPAEKKKRGRQPGYSPKAAKAGATPTPAAPVKEAAPKAPAKPKGPPAKPDDLTQVKGVGGRVAEALNKEGIYTYKDMAAVSLDRYKEILKENNMSKFRDPSDWAKIAAELVAKK